MLSECRVALGVGATSGHDAYGAPAGLLWEHMATGELPHGWVEAEPPCAACTTACHARTLYAS